MKIGIIGLGRMGQAISKRLIKSGYKIIGFDPDQTATKNFKQIGGTPIEQISQIPEQCDFIWLMVPAGKIVDTVIDQIKNDLKKDTIVVDGGNSNFHNTIKRAEELKKQNVFFLDCGTSGGLKGEEVGFSLMIGGEKLAYEKSKKIFEAIAAPNGYDYFGPSGSGHYVKMIHNGIEYAILQSYADGFNLLKHGQYKNLDLYKISAVWKNGSVIRSWILELIEEIFEKDQDFENISGAIGENKTGQWTLEEAKAKNIDMSLLEHALKIREWSRKTNGNYATQLVALIRQKFGGHAL